LGPRPLDKGGMDPPPERALTIGFSAVGSEKTRSGIGTEEFDMFVDIAYRREQAREKKWKWGKGDSDRTCAVIGEHSFGQTLQRRVSIFYGNKSTRFEQKTRVLKGVNRVKGEGKKSKNETGRPGG